MASATVGSLSQACQCSIGNWLVMMVDLLVLRSSIKNGVRDRYRKQGKQGSGKQGSGCTFLHVSGSRGPANLGRAGTPRQLRLDCGPEAA